MTTRNDDLRVRPGRIQQGNHGSKRPQTFVGEVMRAAKKAGMSATASARARVRSRSRFGRGRRAAVSTRLALERPARHDQGARRAPSGRALSLGPLGGALSYLKREGSTREAKEAPHVRCRLRHGG